MNRYLLNISYLGTQFRGIQKVINRKDPAPLDNSSVQSALELALQTLRPLNEVNVVLSSRTDTGVHALQSTVHVDLHRPNNKPYDSNYITSRLNHCFSRDELYIRVLNTKRVPETFHCRFNAQSRTYLYRLAIARGFQVAEGLKQQGSRLNFIPIEEINRCYFIPNPLVDIDKAKAAAKQIQGYHDFRTFMSSSDNNRDHAFFALRRIDEITIDPGQALTTQPNLSRTRDLYDFYDIRVTARSFVYRQVRRIVATLLAAGEGILSEKDVYEMLTIPSKHTWPSSVKIAPPYGLYLTKVSYNEDDLKDESPGEDSNAKSPPESMRDREILPDKLYLGSQDAVNLPQLQEHGITHVLSVGIECPLFLPHPIENLHIPCLDLPESSIESAVQEAREFINVALKMESPPGRVLVHCNAGISRSAAVVIGYLIQDEGIPFEEALEMVRTKRKGAKPNEGFTEQLTKFSIRILGR
ncbi:tRNA pseudouridine synthase [Sergentomyia squamirostris]